jgi:phage terminase large subunit
VARSLGINFRVVPKVSVEDGIHAARMLFPLCCSMPSGARKGSKRLQHYRRDYNQRLNEFKATPVHDWASHGADAFGYLALAFKAPKPAAQPVDDYRPRSSWG